MGQFHGKKGRVKSRDAVHFFLLKRFDLYEQTKTFFTKIFAKKSVTT